MVESQAVAGDCAVNSISIAIVVDEYAISFLRLRHWRLVARRAATGIMTSPLRAGLYHESIGLPVVATGADGLMHSADATS